MVAPGQPFDVELALDKAVHTNTTCTFDVPLDLGQSTVTVHFTTEDGGSW